MSRIIMTAPGLQRRAVDIIERLKDGDVEVFDLELIKYIAKHYPETAFVRIDTEEGCEYSTEYTSEDVLLSLDMGVAIRRREGVE